MLFLGLDLAWGDKNTSGGVVLSYPSDSPRIGGRGAILNVTETLGDDDEIVAWVRHWDEEAGAEGLLLGVDAPLLVPNTTGKRPCEAEIGRRFAKFQAGGASGEPDDFQRQCPGRAAGGTSGGAGHHG